MREREEGEGLAAFSAGALEERENRGEGGKAKREGEDFRHLYARM